MKVIITGATGYIGGAALKRALAVPEVTEVIVLARREPEIQNSKLTTLIKKDFNTYTSDEIAKLKGAEACIWALGSPAGKFEIKMGYPRAALKAFTEHLAPALSEKQQFRFILLSGELVIANQERWVPPPFNALQELGKLQHEWVAHEKANFNIWRSFVVRPAAVHDAGSWGVMFLPGSAKIDKEVLAAALVNIATAGADHQVFSNKELNVLGKEVLSRSKTTL